MSGPEIEQLEAALRADSAEPSPAFTAELDRRVEAGFPKPPRRRRLSLPRFWPALAAATTLIVIAVVGLSVLSSGKDEGGSGPAAAIERRPAPAATAAPGDAQLSVAVGRPRARNV